MNGTVEVELDSRQRVSLAKVMHRRDRTRYRVTLLADGEILLTPVVSLTERELAVVAKPELVAAIRQGVNQAHAGNVTRYQPGHFSKMAADSGINPLSPDGED